MNNLENVIEVKNLYKEFVNGTRKVEVLKGINLEIKRKDVALITGPSGAGKSTLLHILGMLDKPTDGMIKIAGNDINAMDENRQAQLRNKTIGFVFQFHHLLPEFSALENVLIPTMIYNQSEQAKEYAEHILEMVGLSHRLTHKPSELSGGEQQRVAMARAIVNKPDILLADEPTGNLDKANGEALFDMLLKLNQEMDQTLLIVTHSDIMTGKATRLIRLEDGQVSTSH